MLPLQANFKHPIGTIAMPIGMGGYSPIHVKDVASCAAICFAEPKEHYEKVYRLTGPEVLSGKLKSWIFRLLSNICLSADGTGSYV